MAPNVAIEHDSYSELKAFDETKAGVKGLVDAQVTEVPHIFHDPLGTSDDKKPPVSASGFTIPKAFTLRQHRVKGVVKKIKHAAEKRGFFQVINHDVPLSVLEEIKDGVPRFYEEDLEVKKSYFSRELSKRFLYYSNFNLYSSSPINWRDNFAFFMDPNPPKPEDLPEACRNEVLEYSKHVMRLLGGLLFELLSEALGLSSEILKGMGCMKGVRAYAQPLLPALSTAGPNFRHKQAFRPSFSLAGAVLCLVSVSTSFLLIIICWLGSSV